MQLTKAEIADTQIIVTTPEKWDVVTRKPTGEGELASVGSVTALLSPTDHIPSSSSSNCSSSMKCTC